MPVMSSVRVVIPEDTPIVVRIPEWVDIGQVVSGDHAIIHPDLDS
jgi:hypothetical protein